MLNQVNQDVIDCIVGYKDQAPEGVWVHEKILHRSLPKVRMSSPHKLISHAMSPHQVLSKAMTIFTRGFFVKAKMKRISVNQGSIDSISDLHMESYGAVEEFSSTSTGSSPSTRSRPKWFYYGKLPLQLQVSKQLEIAYMVMGKGHKQINLNAVNNWRNWYDNNNSITRTYLTIIENTMRNYSIDTNTIKSILFYSNFYVPDRNTRSHQSITTTPMTRLSITTTPMTNNTVTSESTPMEPQSLQFKSLKARNSTPSSSTPSLMPPQYQMNQLRQMTLNELAVVEEIVSNTNSEFENSIARARALVNVTRERTLRVEAQAFKPRGNQLLRDWLEDGRRYTDGERLPRINLELNPENRKQWFTDSAMSCMRHIIFCFNIPTRTFGSLMNCFAVLLLGRALKMIEFPDRRSLNRRLMRLAVFDWHNTRTKFQAFIDSSSQYGFNRYWYSVTDDSKHLKVDRHAVMISYQESDNESPSFKVLTVSSSGAKDSKGNSNLNVEAFRSVLSNKIIDHYGGNASDHASDARKESRITFQSVLSAERMEHDIVPQPIFLCDPFHIDNLCVNHASIAAFGDTERGNHRQTHHRQLLQSLYDLFQLDKLKYQGLMDELLDGSGNQIVIKVMRERVQRWLANQKNASWVVETMQIKIDGIPVLIRWAHLCGELSSDNGRVISEDILRMLHMPEIMVALTFERDIGLYFAVTSRWHGSPGSLGGRPGFRSIELHILWFEFVCPWWTNATTSPATGNFRSTFEAINTISVEIRVRCNE